MISLLFFRFGSPSYSNNEFFNESFKMLKQQRETKKAHQAQTENLKVSGKFFMHLHDDVLCVVESLHLPKKTREHVELHSKTRETRGFDFGCITAFAARLSLEWIEEAESSLPLLQSY